MNGTYLVIKIDGDVIAEATDVKLKVIADGLEATSQDSGVNAAFIQGKIKIGLAGDFLLASSLTDWDRLFYLVNSGGKPDVTLYYNGLECLNGYGVIRKLSKKGADSGELITGKYGIRYYVQSLCSDVRLITEDGLYIITEDDQEIIVEEESCDNYYMLNDVNQIMTDDDWNRIYIDT